MSEQAQGPLRGKKTVLGVSGGIASYKSIDLARLLVLDGAEVQTVLTQSAASFVQPLPFEVLTGVTPIQRMFPVEGGGFTGDMPHISLSDHADLIIIAPATANIIGKFAGGVGDDFLSTLLLSARPPVLVAPAMNPRMWAAPAVQENVAALRARGHLVMEPGVGRMARAEEGTGRGRMPEPGEILLAARAILLPNPDLAGMKLVVTAGPTRERWDAVRYLSNRSSGKMGFALAGEAARRGADVVLVSGPAALADPPGARVVRVESAAQMYEAVKSEWAGAHALVMAAAVADYRPSTRRPESAKKATGPSRSNSNGRRTYSPNSGRTRGAESWSASPPRRTMWSSARRRNSRGRGWTSSWRTGSRAMRTRWARTPRAPGSSTKARPKNSPSSKKGCWPGASSTGSPKCGKT